MDPDWHTHFNPRSNGSFIQGFATPRHIGDRLSEVVSTRPASFLEDDYAARSVLRNRAVAFSCGRRCRGLRDRKSTRLNSSHGSISYAVFCLKKKKGV